MDNSLSVFGIIAGYPMSRYSWPCSVLATMISPGFIGNDSNLLIVFYVQIMPDDLVMQLHRF